MEVRLSDGSLVVLDAGTGMRALGNRLAREGTHGPVHLLISHTHWDHVMGLPFFAPLWNKASVVRVHPLASDSQERFLRNIFDDIHFPVQLHDIPAQIEWARPQTEEWRIGSARVRRILLNHPGGSQGVRLDDDDGTSLVYLTDNELSPPYPRITALEDLAQFSRHADLVIHDSQYTHADMPLKHGWGHSLIDQVLELGRLSEARRLVLYHHDPDRTDDDLDGIGVHAAQWMAANAPATATTIAAEGMSFEASTPLP